MTLRSRYLVSVAGMATVVIAYVLWQERPASLVGRIERQSTGAARSALPPAAVSAREILDHRADLRLDPRQVERLEALDRRWTEESRRVLSAIEAAQDELSRFFADQGRRGASLAEIQRRSADFRALAGELRERRRRHEEAALGLLTDGQRGAMARPRQPASTGGRTDEVPRG